MMIALLATTLASSAAHPARILQAAEAGEGARHDACLNALWWRNATADDGDRMGTVEFDEDARVLGHDTSCEWTITCPARTTALISFAWLELEGGFVNIYEVDSLQLSDLVHTPNDCILGANGDIIHGQTPESCVDLCARAPPGTCMAFEFATKHYTTSGGEVERPGDCRLQTSSTSGSCNPHGALDLYTPPPGRTFAHELGSLSGSGLPTQTYRAARAKMIVQFVPGAVADEMVDQDTGFEATYACVDVGVGCTDANAPAFLPSATVDDGSCGLFGCTDPAASNYAPEAQQEDGSCVVAPDALAISGIMSFPNITVYLSLQPELYNDQPVYVAGAYEWPVFMFFTPTAFDDAWHPAWVLTDRLDESALTSYYDTPTRRSPLGNGVPSNLVPIGTRAWVDLDHGLWEDSLFTIEEVKNPPQEEKNLLSLKRNLMVRKNLLKKTVLEKKVDVFQEDDKILEINFD